jgi:hypothetical protein
MTQTVPPRDTAHHGHGGDLHTFTRSASSRGTTLLLFLAAVSLVLATGCSADAGHGGFRVAGHHKAADVSAVSCASLVGQPVRPRARCGNTGVSASAGCYSSGARRGDYYWMDTGTGHVVYGRPGGVWRIGAKPLSRGAMATQIGC